MAERVAMFGAHIDAGTLPTGGWRVHTRLNAANPAPTAEAPTAEDGRR
jgi:hypothetical protein